MSEQTIQIQDVTLRIADRHLEVHSSSPDGGQPIQIRLGPADTRSLIQFLVHAVGHDFNERQTFRVPLHEALGVQAFIEDGSNRFRVIPDSLSATGIFVWFPPGPLPILHAGDRLQVELEVPSESSTQPGIQTLSLPCIVRRLEPPGLGLEFAEDAAESPIMKRAKEDQLNRLVIELQQRLIREAF